MATSRIYSVRELPFAAPAVAPESIGPTQDEREVIHLFDRFRNPVLRYVLSFGISLHDSEEVTQEVFLSLFRHLQKSGPQQNLPGWIFRVAHNLALKQRLANHKTVEMLVADPVAAERQSDPSPNPEEQMSFAERQKQLVAVLHALPEEDQCCLRLRAEGLRYREIAAVLGISLGSVSISLTRSLARLARAGGE